MLSYNEARDLVITRVTSLALGPHTESAALLHSLGRVLAQHILADRDYPPFDRSIRDGYAVRSADAHPGATLRCIAELKAGDTPTSSVQPGTCIQIMTGAALPSGADAVIMIEHTHRDGDTVTFNRTASPGQHVVARGSEQSAGKLVLSKSTRLGFAQLASAAQVGAANLSLYRKPRVAILSTGDEVVDFAAVPGPFQIRNSNSVSLSGQVTSLGAEPITLGNARDTRDDLHAKISTGLRSDALILSGGVSAGKYDLVEPVLRELGAEFLFDAVAIRPGKPVVFAVCQGKPVFGLPGNPVSTMVTFDLFVRPAIEILSGALATPLPLFEAVLTQRLSEKTGLTHFLPALAEYGQSPRVTPLAWQGSGDLVAMSRANCLLVVPPDRENIDPGERVQVLPRGL